MRNQESQPTRHRPAASPADALRRASRLLLVALLVFPPHLWAATITVSGTCTLVDAINAANSDAPAGGCPAGSGADTLELTGNVSLTSALPLVNSTITIDGGGATVMRDGGAPNFPIFDVNFAGDLNLDSVKVTNGASAGPNGGGVHVRDGTLTLVNSTVSGNSATTRGGGIYALFATVTIENSTISGNTAIAGGGLYSTYGTLTVTNSTVSGNSAAATNAGGGIFSYGVNTSLTNVTLSGNSAGFGGAIFNYATSPSVSRTIIGNSTGGNCSGNSIVAVGTNLADDTTCGSIPNTLTGLDPVLADNGGPTETHALLAGSSAIDAAGACGLTTDQRGVPRDDGACDVGAFEFGDVAGGDDEDEDGVPDDDDLCPGTASGADVDADGCADAQVDADGDGVCDPGAPSGGPSECTGSDNCPNDSNASQADLDEDGVGDVCDPDADGDGDPATTDCDDLDPSRYHGAEEICNDGFDNDCDGLIDLDDTDGDCDGDGVPNDVDNCPDDYNPFQEDLDEDGQGDVCDDDDDGDGVADLDDNCPVVANPGQEDFDGDGAGDACDDDADGDGVGDFDGDLCHFTTPTDLDAGVPSRSLGKNRWADMDGNGQFDTKGNNPTGRLFTMYTTAGCNCAQIIEICGYGQGHTKFGCSNSVMDTWTGLYDRDGEAPFQCD